MMKNISNKIRFYFCLAIALFTIWAWPMMPAMAVGTMANLPIEMRVSLGNDANELKFFPDRLQLVAGQKYKLLLSNSSPQKHYFTARGFASSSWTQKVDAGNVEIKGAIQELELRPHTTAQWVLVPMKSGDYHLRCTVPGHTESGMVGSISVKS